MKMSTQIDTPIDNPMDDLAEEWIGCLQAKGYRISTPLKMIAEIMATSQHVLSPLQIYDMLREANPGFGLVTVYRNVKKLEEEGLIQRVHQPSGCQSYIAASKGHQHILICQECGRVEFFSGDKLDPLLNDVSRETSYKIESHWLQLFGLCETCQG
jgi:Fur family ferric uptake transcriptional regulator